MFLATDNHILFTKQEAEDFESMYVKLTTKQNEENPEEPIFLEKESDEITSILNELLYDIIDELEEEEKKFVVLPITKIISYLVDCIEDSSKDGYKYKLEKDISEYVEDINKTDVMIHKGRIFNIDPEFEKYHFTLTYICLLASDKYDRDKKAKKAIKKYTAAVLESNVRRIYLNSAKYDKNAILCIRDKEGYEIIKNDVVTDAKEDKANKDINKEDKKSE